MNKPLSKLIPILSLTVGIAGFSFGIVASQHKKIAEAETNRLRQKLTERTASAEPLTTYQKFAAAPQAQEQMSIAITALDAPVEIANTNQPPQRMSFEDRMARMKEEDPEGYEEMIQKRQDRQQTMRYNVADRTATFLDLDTTNMTEEERANHELLVEKMSTVWELTDQFQDPEQPNHESMREMFTEIREIRPLLDMERTVMFKQLGTDLGYEGEEAENFAAQVEGIITTTTVPTPRGRPQNITP